MRSGLLLFALLLLCTWSVDAFSSGTYSPGARDGREKYWAERMKSPPKSTVHSMLRNFSEIGESFASSIEILSSKLMYGVSNIFDAILDKQQKRISINVQEEESNASTDQREDFLAAPSHLSARFLEQTETARKDARDKSQSNILECHSFTPPPMPMYAKGSADTTPYTFASNLQVESSEHQILDPVQGPRLLSNPSYVPADGIIRFTSIEQCYRYSKLVLIKQTTYYCNQVIVEQSWYLSLTTTQRTAQGCIAIVLKLEACLCSEDLRGKYCQYESTVSCDLQILNKPTCPVMNSFNYVSEYPGLPPCVPISKEAVVNYQVKAICKNTSSIPESGPYVYGANSDYIVLYNEKPPSANSSWTPFTGFTYVINTSTLKVTRQRNLTPQLQFVNWNFLGKSVKDNYGTKYNLTTSQLTGVTPFTITLNFKTLPNDITTVGRYTVEFNIIEQVDPVDYGYVGVDAQQFKAQSRWSDPQLRVQGVIELASFSQIIRSSPTTIIILEDAEYKEPFNRPAYAVQVLIIVSLIIIVVAVLVAILLVCRKDPKKELVTATTKVSAAAARAEINEGKEEQVSEEVEELDESNSVFQKLNPNNQI